MSSNDKNWSQASIKLTLWPTLIFFIGLLVVFIGERAIGDTANRRQMVDGLGALLLLVGFGWRAQQMAAAKDPSQKNAEGWMLAASGGILLGLLMYFALVLGKDSLRESLGKGFDRFDGVGAVLWPILIAGGALPLLQMQRSLLSMTDGYGGAEHVDLQRVRYSVQSGLTVALVLVFCFGVNYVASERNTKIDLARFRSTRPSAATQRLVQNLNKPIKAILFYPSPNEVRELVVPYFDDLSKQSPKFTYEVLDHALEPNRSKELSATGNGIIILSTTDDKGKPSQKETLHSGVTLEAAQGSLATLDGDVQKKLLAITRPGRVAYFTVGHGERSFERSSAMDLQKDDLRAPVGDLRQVLQGQGYEVKTLGIGQGLGTKVPGDAGIVFVAGPTEKLLDEEVAALTEYLQGGGHVYVMLDPSSDADASLAPLLKAGGLKYHPELLCNDEVYAVRTHKPADMANIASVSFSSHPSVTTLSRAGGRAAVILPHTGWLEKDGTPAGVTVDFSVRSMPKTWADLDGDFTYKANVEVRKVYDVAAVAQRMVEAKDKKEMRLAVLASIDAASDMVIGNRANLFLVLDTIKWLMGDEATAGETAQESDLPIVHTKSEDKLWFYSTIFAAPALVLVMGLLYTRRVRRRRGS